MVAAILKEIEKESHRLSDEAVHTVYFGGGTPSLLSPDELSALMTAIRRQFQLVPGAEITLEANPDDIRPALLNHWKSEGINRLSIGIQSFREEDLRWMNRAHTAAEAAVAVQTAREAGFDNFNLDLIYGIPGLPDEGWLNNIDLALNTGINHLSAYALTVEPKTALARLIQKEQSADTDPEQQARQFLLLTDTLEARGWEQYEISNFCQPGHRSRHNSAYWEGIPYLGLGPGAHSFDREKRRWNVANNALYIDGIEKNIPVWEEEELTETNRYNEYIMTSLRRREGIDLRHLLQLTGRAEHRTLLQAAAPYLLSGQLISEGHFLKLSKEGRLFADGIAAALFQD